MCVPRPHQKFCVLWNFDQNMPSRCLLARAQFNWHTSLVAFKRDCLLFLSLQTTAIWWRGRRRLRRIIKTFTAHELCQRSANMYSWVGRCGLCSAVSPIFTSNLVVIYIQFNRWMSTRRAGASRIVFWESDKIVTLTSIVGLCDINKYCDFNKYCEILWL